MSSFVKCVEVRGGSTNSGAGEEIGEVEVGEDVQEELVGE